MLKNVLNEIHALNAHYFTHETGVVLIKFPPGRGAGGLGPPYAEIFKTFDMPQSTIAIF